MLLKRLTVGPFASNCYIIGAETGDGIMVDPGAEATLLLKGVSETGLAIRLIVLTHGHMDHLDALAEVKKATGAAVAVHSGDAGMLGRKPANPLFSAPRPTPPEPDRLLGDGDRLECGDLTFQVLHTPGHSPGSICLLGHGVLFSGDTLFSSGIGRYDFPGGSYRLLMDSIHNKLMTLPDDTIVYPGHGPETTIGAERRGNPFLQE